MGAAPSRKVLCEQRESGESQKGSIGRIGSFFKTDRLVRDELCKDVQPIVRERQWKICDSLPLIQKPLKGIQQEDV
jgi:hypothetical protein